MRERSRLVRDAGVDVVSSRRPRPDASRPCGTPPPCARTAQAVREALPDQGTRLRGSRPAPARRHADHRVRHPAADGAVVRRGRAGHRSASDRRGAGERRQPALPAHRRWLAAIRADELLLLDLWGKLRDAGRGLRRHHLGGLYRRPIAGAGHRAFDAARARATPPSRLVQDRRPRPAGPSAAGSPTAPPGRSSRTPGYGGAILHRTGHSLGEEIHGNGAHLDDYETHDERRLMPGTGFTIEPGVYFDTFGVRTEINVAWGPGGPEVTGPRQAVSSHECEGEERHVHPENHAVLRAAHRGRLAGGRHGDRVAPRSVAGLVGADGAPAPPTNSAPLSGPVDAATFRNIAKA